MEAKVYENIVRNRYEMFAYTLIAMARSPEVVSQVVSIKWEEMNGPEDQDLVREALRIQQVISNRNWVEYFRTMRRPSTNYFIACLMLSHIGFMRQSAVQNLAVANNRMGFPLSLIQKKLNLPSVGDAKGLIEALGYYTLDHGNNKIIKRIEDQDQWTETFKKWRQSGPLVEHDTLRGDVKRSRLIKLGMEAIDEAEADLGNDATNDLDKIDDFEAILNMPKQQKVPVNPMKRQESIARKLKEQEHAKQMAIVKAQEEKAA